MITFVRTFVVFSALFLGSVAHAQFESVQIPEWLDFECDEGRTIGECEDELALEIWNVTYYDQFQNWKEELFFNTNIYFHPYEESYGEDGTMVSHKGLDFLDEGSLIDVRYTGFRSYGWAYAIDVVCKSGWQYRGKDCAPKLRLMDFAGDGERPDILPESLSETFLDFKSLVRWMEADIRSCRGALDHLLAFPRTAKTKDFWHKQYVEFLKGVEVETPDEIFITADGDGVLIRARGFANPSSKNTGTLGEKFVMHSDRNGGPGYDWALEMKAIVEPCLNPSTALAPWEKVLAAEKLKK